MSFARTDCTGGILLDPMIASSHVHDMDRKWMDWLRIMSRKLGVSGRTLYEEYAKSDTGDWYKSIEHYQTTISNGWTFCRGSTTLSSSDIAGARNRYLDKYPLTAEEKGSAGYVDTLMMLDEKQIALRCQRSSYPTCASCREMELEIRRLRLCVASTLDLGVPEQSMLDSLMVSQVFRRHYILDSSATMARSDVRLHVERILQKEVGPDEVLLSKGEPWCKFLRNTMGISGTSSTALRCRKRSIPIPAAGV